MRERVRNLIGALADAGVYAYAGYDDSSHFSAVSVLPDAAKKRHLNRTM